MSISIESRMESGIFFIGNRQFRIRTIVDADESEVLRLFFEVFAHKANSLWYDWKYRQGNGQAVGLWDHNDRLVAHYAGMPRAMLWHGVPMNSVQIGDVMVDPHVRGLMTRKGPFFQVSTRFFYSQVGKGKSYRLAFGFPNQRALKLGSVLNLYHNAGNIHLLLWHAKIAPIPIGWHWVYFPPNSISLSQQVTDVWAAMSLDMRDCVLGVRDANYLRWRYIDRPDRQYRLFALQRWPWGGTAAIIVMHFEKDKVQLLDIIGTRKVFKVAIQAAVNEAARAGATALTAWASSAVVTMLGSGAEVTESGASLAVARASTLTEDEVAKAQWWMMGGDTDFL